MTAASEHLHSKSCSLSAADISAAGTDFASYRRLMSPGRSVSYAFAAVPVPTEINSILSSPGGQAKRYVPSVAMT
jgi:hypothetical protein